MMFYFRHLCLLAFSIFAPLIPAGAEETVFAGYFDIPLNSVAGTEVVGRIHLERNKDILSRPIPPGYRFSILEQPSEALFKLDTIYDSEKRIMGRFTVALGKNTGKQPRQYLLTAALSDSGREIKRFPITIRITGTTLYQTLYERYTQKMLDIPRLYGRKHFSDAEVTRLINELTAQQGRFSGFDSYTARPEAYLSRRKVDPAVDKKYGTIEFDWEEICNRIGGLGYAYLKSPEYGPSGKPEKHEALKRAIYAAFLTYSASVPIEGSDIEFDGKPIGKCTGDGFALLHSRRLVGSQHATHQWILTDPLIVPLVALMPEILEDIRRGDRQAEQVQAAAIRYFQLFFSIVKNRRRIDVPSERWGELQDVRYSSGAWSDANLGHRSRTILALPLLWADYNRPITYVQYWYSDFYRGKPFPGFSFSTGWSPHGVVADTAYWVTKFNTPTHLYVQSGFQPDGTVSHHIGRGTDIAMQSYGFGYLVECMPGFAQLKDTPFRISSDCYQFILDRLLRIYPKFFYKGRLDCLTAGRGYSDDMHKFVMGNYLPAIEELFAVKSSDTRIDGEEALRRISDEIRSGKHELSLTEAFWVNEYLIHRRGGEGEKPFFASVKLKSERTVGAEDFGQIRKSWHFGSGVLLLRVRGNEYDAGVLGNMDFHMLPGITEEWRTDPLPRGHSQASLPGRNKVTGVLADGRSGVALYHHLPRETYSSATALKTYHFIGDRILALGSNIGRLRKGQEQEIFTCLDQSAFSEPLLLHLNGKLRIVSPGESVSLRETLNGPAWCHAGNRGLLIYPYGAQDLIVKTGSKINTTDHKIADGKPNYLLALGHGQNPDQNGNPRYRYLWLPNVTAEQMPELLKCCAREIAIQNTSDVHAVSSEPDKTVQFAFFKPGQATVGNCTVSAEQPLLLILTELTDHWRLAISNPHPDRNAKQLMLDISVLFPEGVYTYTAGGIYPRPGETVKVERRGDGSRITVELPDGRDEKYYNYQSDLYSAVPIVVDIPKGGKK